MRSTFTVNKSVHLECRVCRSRLAGESLFAISCLTLCMCTRTYVLCGGGEMHARDRERVREIEREFTNVNQAVGIYIDTCNSNILISCNRRALHCFVKDS